MGARLPQADGFFCCNRSAKHWRMQTLMSSMQTSSLSLSQLLRLRVTDQSIITGKTTGEREGGNCGR